MVFGSLCCALRPGGSCRSRTMGAWKKGRKTITPGCCQMLRSNNRFWEREMGFDCERAFTQDIAATIRASLSTEVAIEAAMEAGGGQHISFGICSYGSGPSSQWKSSKEANVTFMKV